MNKEEWRAARDAAYSFETLSGKIARATTENTLVFIAEQCKTASDRNKEPLRKLWIAKRDHLRALAIQANILKG